MVTLAGDKGTVNMHYARLLKGEFLLVLCHAQDPGGLGNYLLLRLCPM